MNQLNTCPNSAMKRSNQRRSNTKFDYNKELLEAAIQRYTSKQKFLKTNRKGVHFPAKLKTVGLQHYTTNAIHHSLFQEYRHQVWNSQLQYRYLYYCHRTEHLLLDDYFLKFQKSTFKKKVPAFGVIQSKYGKMSSRITPYGHFFPFPRKMPSRKN